MTRPSYPGCVPEDPLALLDRYLIEIVEDYNLCPWARSARTNGELQRAVIAGDPPSIETWVATAEALLARPDARVVMIVAPEFTGSLLKLRDVRAEVAKRVPAAGVAEFHPDADLDLGSPARLVRFLRRSPHPMLQFVPLAILDTVRSPDRVIVEPHEIAKLLAGVESGVAAPLDIAERIAETNHATVVAHRDEIVVKLDEISACRSRS